VVGSYTTNDQYAFFRKASRQADVLIKISCRYSACPRQRDGILLAPKSVSRWHTMDIGESSLKLLEEILTAKRWLIYAHCRRPPCEQCAYGCRNISDVFLKSSAPHTRCLTFITDCAICDTIIDDYLTCIYSCTYESRTFARLQRVPCLYHSVSPPSLSEFQQW
jgi:hypothetical protein